MSNTKIVNETPQIRAHWEDVSKHPITPFESEYMHFTKQCKQIPNVASVGYDRKAKVFYLRAHYGTKIELNTNTWVGLDDLKVKIEVR